MKYPFLLFLFIFIGITSITAQYNGNPGHQRDSSHHKEFAQKPVKGPNHGRMLRSNTVKLEMVTPTNTKKTEVSYFVFDSLDNPLDAKNYTGIVKYIFGDPNQYIEVYLVPKGKNNQYMATLEDWNEYKKAIVTLKANGQTYRYVFFNAISTQTAQSPSGNGQHGHHGGHYGGGGGGNVGGGNNFGGGGMR
jgi:hypothetical protein